VILYQQLPIKKIKTKMTNSLRVVFLLLFIVAFLLLYFIEEKRFDNAQNEFDIVLHKSMQHAFKNNIRIYTFFAKKLVYTSRLKDYLKDSQREKLYERLKPKWKFFLEENPYLENLTIHNPDGTVFLRMHKPEVYGDSVIETSPMIKAIHKQKVLLRGSETIKTKTIFRILMPIFDDDKYIGALEVGINIIYFIEI
jgi:exoribonuclease R